MRPWSAITLVASASALALSGSCDNASPPGPHHDPIDSAARVEAADSTSDHVDPPRHPLTRNEIEEHIGEPAQITWIKAARLFVDGVESCVDGRDDHAVIGTPGGDAGELLLALAAVESLTGHELSYDEIERVFDDHLRAFGDFYLHSDVHAMTELAGALSGDPRFAAVDARLHTRSGIERLVRRPPTDLQEPLLEHLLEPRAIGCGHLRLVAGHPARYQVRAGLLKALLRAYYHGLWAAREDLRFEVLTGEHSEGAIVSVHLDGPIHPYTRVPMIEPLHRGSEVFVHHPEVVKWLRRQRADFMHEEEATLGVFELDPNVVAAEIERIGELQLTATCDTLGHDLPHYDVYVNADQLVVR